MTNFGEIHTFSANKNADHAFALLFLAVKLCSRFLTTFSEQDQEVTDHLF